MHTTSRNIALKSITQCTPVCIKKWCIPSISAACALPSALLPPYTQCRAALLPYAVLCNETALCTVATLWSVVLPCALQCRVCHALCSVVSAMRFAVLCVPCALQCCVCHALCSVVCAMRFAVLCVS